MKTMINEKVRESMKHTYGEDIVGLLESERFPTIQEDNLGTQAIVLENTKKEIARLYEDTSTSDVAVFTPIFMPMTRRIQPALIANRLLGVQPMSQQTGYINTLIFKYTGFGADANDRLGGRIDPGVSSQIIEITGHTLVKGDVISSDNVLDTNLATVIYVEGDLLLIDTAVFSAGGIVYDNAAVPAQIGALVIANTYSNQLTFKKILKGYTGSLPTTQAEILGYDMKEIGFTVTQTLIEAKSRKLKAEYTVEMYQNLKDTYGLNADEELMNMMSSEVLNELDREVIDSVNSWAAPSSDFTIANGVGASGSTRFEMESMAHIGVKIQNEAREVGKLTRMGSANIILATPRVVTVLEQLRGFKAIENDSMLSTNVAGASVVGTFGGMEVILDNFTDREYVTVLYKGDNRASIGYYSPYKGISFTRVTHPDTGQPAIILSSRYGLIENPLNQDNGVGIFGRTFDVIFDSTSVLA